MFQKTVHNDKLWTGSFISACVGNFLLFYAFYLLLPVFPLYLIETFGSTKSVVGIVLSVYTISALLIRPFAGFILDMFRRKPLYLMAYMAFVLVFISYPLVTTINLFLIFRILHGFAFGFVTTAANSFVVDILPASRRGEGLGFFGVANNLAMAFGPMTSLLMHGKFSFDTIFLMAIVTGLAGFVFAASIKAPKTIKPEKHQPLALDRFFLVKGFKAGFTLMLTGIPYGILMTFLAIYGQELNIQSGSGWFFSIMALGLIFSRLFSGWMIDKGQLNRAIAIGLIISVVGLFLLSSLQKLNGFSHLTVEVLYMIIPLVLGVGYGMIFPAYNTLFVNLAPNNRRATASSTFMTSWDLGVGAGLIVGGKFADSTGGLPLAFLSGTLMVLFAYIYYIKVAGPHFTRNKLR